MEEGYSTADIQALLSVLLPAQQKQYGKSISAKLLLSALKGHSAVEEGADDEDDVDDKITNNNNATTTVGDDGVRASHTLSVPFYYAPYRQTKGEAKTSRLHEISTSTHRPSSVFTSKEYRQKNQRHQEVGYNNSTTAPAQHTLGNALVSRASIPDGEVGGPTTAAATAVDGIVSATNSNPGLHHTAAASSTSSNHVSGATVRRILSKSAPLNKSTSHLPKGEYDDDNDDNRIGANHRTSSGTRGGGRKGATSTPPAKKVSVSGKSRWGHGSPLTEVVIAGTF